MKMMILYVVILFAVVMPILFRRSAGLRVLSAIILCAVALLHLTHLMTLHRLVAEDVTKQLATAPGERLPSEGRPALDSIQKHSQGQMWLFAALSGAWMILTLVPAKACDRTKGSPVSNPVQ